jgi:hypothetical protein
MVACRSCREKLMVQQCRFIEQISVDVVDPLYNIYKVYRNVFDAKNISVDAVDPFCGVCKVYRNVFSAQNIFVDDVDPLCTCDLRTL